jgi:hypothetical protein
MFIELVVEPANAVKFNALAVNRKPVTIFTRFLTSAVLPSQNKRFYTISRQFSSGKLRYSAIKGWFDDKSEM